MGGSLVSDRSPERSAASSSEEEVSALQHSRAASSHSAPDAPASASASSETAALTNRDVILAHVSEERDRQDAKWGGVPGEDRRDDHTYAAVLGEEFGEVCQAWLQRDTTALREELVQTAAVAVAWIEELDNGGAVPRADW